MKKSTCVAPEVNLLHAIELGVCVAPEVNLLHAIELGVSKVLLSPKNKRRMHMTLALKPRAGGIKGLLSHENN